MHSQHKPNTRIGLALGSGAARGLAHIGVLKVLEQANIPITCIAGTSIGALIGALYAAGVSVAQMEEVAHNVDWQRLAGLIDPIIPTSGLLDGKKVAQFVAEMLPVQTFEELSLPFAVVTTDVETGEMLIIKRGPLCEALRAAISFPGIFTPVQFAGRFLVDGGLCNPVPVDIARDLGADRVIAVCAIPEVEKRRREAFFPDHPQEQQRKNHLLDFFTSQHIESILGDLWRPADKNENKRPPFPAAGKERKPPSMLKIFTQCIAIMENEINRLRLEREEADLLIRPQLDEITLFDFHKATSAIRAGEQATRNLLPQIYALAAN
ncbi:MAG: patatin-like phospholipase family protein [Desulfuromonadaceae bacterium]|jgi:NTE family protein